MKLLIKVSIVVIIVLLIFTVVFTFYRSLFHPITQVQDSFNFVIYEGESFISVAQRLENKGIISSANILRIYAQIQSIDSDIQKGSYQIPSGLSAVGILNFLSSGRQELIRITIPEGKTIRQVAEIFGKSGIVSEEDFKISATGGQISRELGIPAETVEGYLYPDTYYFPMDYSSENIIRHMISLFFTNLEKIYPLYKELDPQELHNRIIMASIVEREYRSANEAPLIASVFYNRLEQGIRLESCATIVYVMTEIEGLQHPERIFFADLERPSVYNTYYNAGLPPSPIASAGMVSLSASFYPAESDYLFFVLEDPSASEHVFSKNYREHLIASESYYVKLN